ncbi:peptidylprolyl isomerase [Epibacterium sp. SM1979]|uniref:Peptidylprolyl isomerase n=1 Tax=Tritonibacter litoralis TaxID=2662264 RepID=A0A843Y7A3_9RHOB|nr:peptidylprolyl isomerase [Tritonibacter litoralis]MQQ07040.1 peptidylprolyl isomerase [Tritonibacter litoralis]
MKKLSKTFVWILMGMLILGLAGFGAVSFTGSGTAVATVGDEEVSINDYARALQQEQRAIQAQSGQAFSISQMIELGLDRTTLNRLVSVAAIDNEVKRIGVSSGDDNLLREISEIPAFQGIDGSFDREAYGFALQNAGLSEREFEADIRQETARTLVQGAVISGVKMPETMRATLLNYVGSRRSFSYVLLSPQDVILPQVAASDAELQTFYDENIAAFTLPETKVITYVQLSPEMVMADIDVEEAALVELYEQRADQYNLPARRLVERLVFGDQAAAEAAKARIDAGEVTFEGLVAERGLDLADIDLGDLTPDALGDAAEGVFAVAAGAVTAPLPSDLGPALYRVNGILDARNTSLDEVRDELRRELAGDRARRLIEARAEDIEDLLAGGVTLEELANSDGLSLGQINWTADSDADIAAYDGFRNRAAAVTLDDFPTVDFLADGSLYALRLDETLEPRPEPFADARDAVNAAWEANRVSQALEQQAETLVTQTTEGGDFPETAEVQTETALTRTAYLDHTPANLMNQVFEMAPGDLRVVTGEDNTVVVRLDEVLPPAETDELNSLADAIAQQLDQSLAQGLFEAYANDLLQQAQPQVNQQALSAVQANFH